MDYRAPGGGWLIGVLIGYEAADLEIGETAYRADYTHFGIYGGARLSETLLFDGAATYGTATPDIAQGGVSAFRPAARRQWRPEGRMGGGDGVRAWRFLRRNRRYRAAWLRIRPPPGLAERAPFAVRLQTAADYSAARFGLLAWLDPFARDGPASPFWAEAPMAAAMTSPGGIPLTGMAAAGAASVAGLRTGDGALVLKIERCGAAVQVQVQVQVRDGGAFPEEGGLSLLREVVRIEDLWEGPGTPSPHAGRGMGITNF